MSNQSSIQKDEADLGELLSAIWAHKIFIIALTGICIFLAGFYTLTADKKFTANAIFELEEAGGGQWNKLIPRAGCFSFNSRSRIGCNC